MFTEDEQARINALCDRDTEFSYYINRIYKDQKYLLSSISHEIKNPLTLIHSTIQLMERNYPEVKKIKYWPSLINDIQDVNTLVNDLTNYNHCENLKLTNVDLYLLIADLSASIPNMVPDKDIKIEIHADDTSRSNISYYCCDYIKMKQVFTNILKNAVEAIEKHGDINIYINANPKDLVKNINGINYMEIEFCNNGNPIPEDTIKTIFDPFITHKVGGTGVGLPVCQKIIQAHGGFIHAKSNEELTKFIIKLPF